MDQMKIGNFIAGKRKEKGWTQKQLAERLGVSDKSVSKWERGVCLPDVSLYQSLCGELGISLNEFFAGEKIEQSQLEQRAEENILGVARDGKSRRGRLQKIIIALAVIAALFAGCTAAAVHFISEKGYFISDYVRPYQANDSESAVIDSLVPADSGADLFSYKVGEEFSAMKVSIKTFHHGKLISNGEEMELAIQTGEDGEGNIAFIVDHEKGTGRITVISGGKTGGSASADGIQLVKQEKIPEYGVYSHTGILEPVKVEKGKAIPIAVHYISEEDLFGLAPEDVESYYAENGQHARANTWTFLLTVTFE